MDDYIKRKDALNASRIVYIECLEMDNEDFIEAEADDIPVVFKRDIASIPSADVVEVKHGKWIYPSDIIGFGRCSNCKALWDIGLLQNRFFRHCPKCGISIPEPLKGKEK